MKIDLKKQDEVIQKLVHNYNEYDILSISRRIGISKEDFYVSKVTIHELVEKFMDRVNQVELFDELVKELESDTRIRKDNNTSDKSAEIFGKLLNFYLESFKDIYEKDFDESELFDPIEFEDKMKFKACFNEDLIKKGINKKPQIAVLRRKAYALNYTKYTTLIQKLAKYYTYNICNEFPVKEYSADERFTKLYLALIKIVPDELFDRDIEIDDYVEGIIYDAISKCLIFNE